MNTQGASRTAGAPSAAQRPAAREQGARPLLQLRNVSKRFGGVVAVNDVSLDLYAGEVVALVGNNGAGKSSIMRLIFGLHAPDDGTVVLDGEPVRFRGPRDARERGIESVPQELALAGHLSVAANIFLGREITRGFGPFRILDKRAMRARAEELVTSFGIHIPDMSDRVFNMSGGQQQGVAIARATAWGSRIVVLDEPTAALGPAETARVERTILRLKEAGLAVILVSHDLEQVFRVSDRIAVMRRARCVAQIETADSSTDQVVALITGSSLGAAA
ncbi:ATP-binding cassette domain-containing protein [Paraburkholderia sp.]|uniref:ATP-binding cassette domain-containing protein n=1 Tax=Paraburkholderia sp. TaxID=1926495 RepID=UPI0039E6E075